MHAFGADFDVPAGYLHHPSIGIPPAHVSNAVAESVERWRRGADGPPDFDDAVAVTREAFGQLIGVPGGRVAIGGPVSQLIANVAAGLPDGARVFTAASEFTSVTFPFAVHAHRGVRVSEVVSGERPGPVEAYA